MPTITTKDGSRSSPRMGQRSADDVSATGPLSADDWDTQMLFFLNNGFRVIAHDRPRPWRRPKTGDAMTWII